MEERGDEDEVERFVLEQIESVPHLEALLLFWKSRPRGWSVDELAGRLYVDRESVLTLLADLASRSLVEAAPEPDLYRYRSRGGASDELIVGLGLT